MGNKCVAPLDARVEFGWEPCVRQANQHEWQDDQCPHVGHNDRDDNLATLYSDNHKGHKACKGSWEVRSHEVGDPLVIA